MPKARGKKSFVCLLLRCPSSPTDPNQKTPSKKEASNASEVTAIPSPSTLPSPPIVDDPIPCTTFDRFPKLPVELRLKIWQFALPGPRIVTVKAHVLRTHVAQSVRGVKFTSPGTPVPSILHTSREARAEALKTYTLGLKTYCCSGRFYVDYTKDTIYLNSVERGSYFDLGAFARDMSEKERRKIQHLAVEQDLFDNDRFENTEIIFDLRELKTFTLVMEKDEETRSGLVLFQEPQDIDSTVISWSVDDDDFEDIWPHETKDWIEGVLEDVKSDHANCGAEKPKVEFKVLAAAN